MDWINGMIWLGYFMAGKMWHLNKQIYHCNTVLWILFYIRALRKDLGYNLKNMEKNAHVGLSFCTVFVILRYSFYLK
jgi:hypothetical protein